MIVSVYVLDEDNETTRLRQKGPGRNQAMFRIDTVDPDYRIARMYLGMEWSTARISNQSTLLESEDVHEKPLRRVYVLVHSQWNNGVGSPWRSFFLDLGRAQFRRRLYFWLSDLRISRNFSQISFMVSRINVFYTRRTTRLFGWVDRSSAFLIRASSPSYSRSTEY